MADWVFGPNAAIEAVHAKRADLVQVVQPVSPRLQRVIDAAVGANVTIEKVSKDILNRRAQGARHQNIAVRVSPFVYTPLDDFAGAPGAIMILDGVTDAGNLGAICRSAWAMGAAGIVIPKNNAARVTPTTERASAGATSHLPIACVTNLSRCIEQLKQHGRWVYAAAANGDVTLEQLDTDEPCAFLLGSEGKGLRPGVAKAADQSFAIPMVRSFDSLNVSVAAALCLYRAQRLS
jgi:23S rRNA (guanosine2251-2'-O)-methyltransferase